MEYKILIKLFVPQLEESYELFVPFNKTIGELSLMLCKTINEISKVFPISNGAMLCNRKNGVIYDKNLQLRNTDIRNGTELLIF